MVNTIAPVSEYFIVNHFEGKETPENLLLLEPAQAGRPEMEAPITESGYQLFGAPPAAVETAPARTPVLKTDTAPVSSGNRPAYTPVDPLFASQWHFGFLGDIETIWDEYTGDGVAVGVYDDGLQYSHWDLAPNYDASLEVTVGGSTIDPDPTASGDPHGTSVAGLIAAANNGMGGVGVAHGASLTGVNIFSGPADINNNFAGFLEAADQLENFDVVNHSWGSFPSFNPLYVPGDQQVIAEYEEALALGRGGLGTVQVQAAGNDSSNADGDWMNSSRATVTVGAFDDDGDASWYSNHGASLLVSAPTSGDSLVGNARQVTTDLLGSSGYSASDYTDASNGFGGTSGATPIVAGVVALMLDANPNLGWRDVQDILAYSATEQGSGIGGGINGDENHAWYYNGADNWNGGGLHFSEDYGFGGVNAYNAVRMAEVWNWISPARTSANEDSFAQSFTGSLAITGGPHTASFSIGQDMEISYVNITLDITHSWLSDIVVDIISPDGTTTRIFDRDGSSTLATTGWSWTFGMNSFKGENAMGTWQIVIEDEWPTADDGTLTGITFEAYGTDAASPTFNLDDDAYHYTDEIFDALADDPSRQNLMDSSGTDWINLAAVSTDAAISLIAGNTSTIGGTSFLTIDATSDIENAIGGDGNDSLSGNSLDNVLIGMRGDDYLFGDDGNDILVGHDGNDTIDGWNGDDTVDAGFGDDVVLGYYGDDILNGEEGNDEIHGENGHDRIDGGTGDNLLYGGNGNDLIIALDGMDEMFGGFGDDDLRGAGNNDRLFGEDGNDQLRGGTGFDEMDGGDGDDFMDGQADGDLMYGGAGNDEMNGGVGNDVLDGQEDDDLLRGQSGNDVLNGGFGMDLVYGGIGNDNVRGDEDDDTVWGQGGNDTVRGGDGNDFVNGGGGDDRIYGGYGDDTVNGAQNSDYVYGNAGNDMVYGHNQGDWLYGGSGNDKVWGQQGNDYLDGGAGDDTLNGGSNADILFYGQNYDSDVFSGFEDNIDQIELEGAIWGGGLTVANVIATYATGFGGGAHTLFDFGGGNELRVFNMTTADLMNDITIV